MSAEIFLKQGEAIYRFLRVAQHNDGSLYVTLLRQHNRREGAAIWDDAAGAFVPDPEAQDGPRRFSYHTTGRVNYGSVIRTEPRFFEPLFDVTQRNTFAAISVPSLA